MHASISSLVHSPIVAGDLTRMSSIGVDVIIRPQMISDVLFASMQKGIPANIWGCNERHYPICASVVHANLIS
jgi:hypothetical protein